MSNPEVEKNDQDFVLKHRITGAAFLLFFGALVLPWLLGPPSEAQKEQISEVVVVDAEKKTISEVLESEILAELRESIEDEEQVYISKITPEGKVSELVSAKEEKNIEPEQTISKIQPIDTPKPATPVKNEPEIKSADEKKIITQNVAKEAESVKKQTEDKPLSEKELARIAAAELAAALEAESTDLAPKITSGWVVQVGMFVDKQKATNVFTELGKKGFKPTTSVVDTNLGLGTGTRVWLGPFKERQEAVDMKAQLAKQTGTSGFIRSYP